MKTIKQKLWNSVEIDYNSEGDLILKSFSQYLPESAGLIGIEKDSIPALIQALLPKGKAIIDVPEGYEIAKQNANEEEKELISNIIDQRETEVIFIENREECPRIAIRQGIKKAILLERNSIEEFVKALLPKGKAIIDVPEGCEIESCNSRDAVYKVNSLDKVMTIMLRKLPEPFVFPEHLPDGTRLQFERECNSGHLDWFMAVPHPVSGVYYPNGCHHIRDYNVLAHPEDRIIIPDWLEKEPRTIVKGE